MAKQRQKARIFIGSSAEALDEVNEINCLLDEDAWVTPWNSLFEVSDIVLQKLCDALEDYDFAAFIFAPDDVATIRKKKYAIVRDNVLFELGLFIGRLGRKRTFIVRPRHVTDFRLPTDLLGITMATYQAKRPDKDLKAELNPACTEIRRIIRRLGPLRRKPRKSRSTMQKNVTKLIGKGLPVPTVRLPKIRRPPGRAAMIAKKKVHPLPKRQHKKR